jgi:hypothetical protein
VPPSRTAQPTPTSPPDRPGAGLGGGGDVSLTGGRTCGYGCDRPRTSSWSTPTKRSASRRSSGSGSWTCRRRCARCGRARRQVNGPAVGLPGPWCFLRRRASAQLVVADARFRRAARGCRRHTIFGSWAISWPAIWSTTCRCGSTSRAAATAGLGGGRTRGRSSAVCSGRRPWSTNCASCVETSVVETAIGLGDRGEQRPSVRRAWAGEQRMIVKDGRDASRPLLSGRLPPSAQRRRSGRVGCIAGETEDPRREPIPARFHRISARPRPATVGLAAPAIRASPSCPRGHTGGDRHRPLRRTHPQRLLRQVGRL